MIIVKLSNIPAKQTNTELSSRARKILKEMMSPHKAGFLGQNYTLQRQPEDFCVYDNLKKSDYISKELQLIYLV